MKASIEEQFFDGGSSILFVITTTRYTMQRLVCHETQESYPIDSPIWRSESGGVLDLEFLGSFDPMEVKHRPADLWRYHEAIPVARIEDRISFAEGMTPLVAMEIAGRSVQVKLDYLFPSGSYKDRGSTVLMSQAKAIGIESVVQDSSGNAGASIATYAALAGIACEIFVPDSTSPAKLDQMRACGAALSLIPGSREDTAAAALKAAEHEYYASHVWNPFFLHGTKTFAFEIAEQMNWQIPDTVILPAGNGTLLLGAYIGFSELQRMGITDRMPVMIGVQAAACAPLTVAWNQGSFQPASIVSSPTSAEGIAIATPRRGEQMLRAIRETNGRMISVEEEEIVESLHWLCQRGYFVEPTSAAVFAGAKTYLKSAARDETVLTVLTGHGLKAAGKIARLLNKIPSP